MEIKIEPASSIVEAREDGTITLTFRRADGAEWVQPHTLDEALRLAERLTAAIQSV
ncbi:MAG: hypothetical protein GWN84_08435, partial [Gammaproteobacteria bacterium]|nr:hypothetical protein [Gammaproteobacteria bacterium]NIR29325.1 hypothetical protein [Gammaproteobacteria bacterium]NIR82895.1 hypothetical protein [Gammaproteobacteria bacterium]NIU04056.1 hypothetical protein [Gammaproteobacteria bacterium]NIV51365.1 hypothetical protein [Gammaproteobacteria bacterium]